MRLLVPSQYADVLTRERLLQKAREVSDLPLQEFRFMAEYQEAVYAYVADVFRSIMDGVARKFGVDPDTIRKASVSIPAATLVKAMGQDVSEIDLLVKALLEQLPLTGKDLKAIYGKFGIMGKESVKPLRIAGKSLTNPKTGKLLTGAEWRQIENSIVAHYREHLDGIEDEIALRCSLLALLRQSMGVEKVPIETQRVMGWDDLQGRYGKAEFPRSIKAAREHHQFDLVMVEATKYAAKRAGEFLAVKDGKLKQRIVASVRNIVEGSIEDGADAGKLAARLYRQDPEDVLGNKYKDNLDAMDRDWRRIATTETSFAINNGFLSAVLQDAEGEPSYVVYTGRPYAPEGSAGCNQFIGNIYRLVGGPTRGQKMDDRIGIENDDYASGVAWPGKNNIGRKPSDWWAAIPTHPSCRHWWEEIWPDTERYDRKTMKVLPKVATKSFEMAKSTDYSKLDVAITVSDATLTEKQDKVGELEALTDVERECKARGIKTRRIAVRDRSPEDLLADLKKHPPDLVVNLHEWIEKKNVKSVSTCSVLDLLSIPYTGNDHFAHATATDKGLTKMILRGAGVPTADWYLVQPGEEPSMHKLGFPCIVKPNATENSFGIDEGAVVKTKQELTKRIRKIHREFEDAALVETFLDGRELNCPIYEDGKGELHTLPLVEVKFSGDTKMQTWNSKFKKGSKEHEQSNYVVATVGKKLETEVQSMARRCFRLLRCRDYMRVDIRTDKEGHPFVLEVNPNSDISWDAMGKNLKAGGFKSVWEFLEPMLRRALARGREKRMTKSAASEKKLAKFAGKTLCFDFDGVIHSATVTEKGPGHVSGKPVRGIKSLIDNLRRRGYRIVVQSARCRTPEGMKGTRDALKRWGIEVDDVVVRKPIAQVYVDDRAVRFDGDAKKLGEDIERNKKSWMEKSKRVWVPPTGKTKGYYRIDPRTKTQGSVVSRYERERALAGYRKVIREAIASEIQDEKEGKRRGWTLPSPTEERRLRAEGEQVAASVYDKMRAEGHTRRQALEEAEYKAAEPYRSEILRRRDPVIRKEEEQERKKAEEEEEREIQGLGSFFKKSEVEDLVKAFALKHGLVSKRVTVKGPTKSYQAVRWVSPGEVSAAQERAPKGEALHEASPADTMSAEEVLKQEPDVLKVAKGAGAPSELMGRGVIMAKSPEVKTRLQNDYDFAFEAWKVADPVRSKVPSPAELLKMFPKLGGVVQKVKEHKVAFAAMGFFEKLGTKYNEKAAEGKGWEEATRIRKLVESWSTPIPDNPGYTRTVPTMEYGYTMRVRELASVKKEATHKVSAEETPHLSNYVLSGRAVSAKEKKELDEALSHISKIVPGGDSWAKDKHLALEVVGLGQRTYTGQYVERYGSGGDVTRWIRVDPKFSDALTHEFGHFLDFTKALSGEFIERAKKLPFWKDYESALLTFGSDLWPESAEGKESYRVLLRYKDVVARKQAERHEFPKGWSFRFGDLQKAFAEADDAKWKELLGALKDASEMKAGDLERLSAIRAEGKQRIGWGWKLASDKKQKEHSEYLVRDTEVFARMFEQYVSMKSGGQASKAFEAYPSLCKQTRQLPDEEFQQVAPILKRIVEEKFGEGFMKALHLVLSLQKAAPGLVKKPVTVRAKGKTFQSHRWVRTGEEPAKAKPTVKLTVESFVEETQHGSNEFETDADEAQAVLKVALQSPEHAAFFLNNIRKIMGNERMGVRALGTISDGDVYPVIDKALEGGNRLGPFREECWALADEGENKEWDLSIREYATMCDSTSSKGDIWYAVAGAWGSSTNKEASILLQETLKSAFGVGGKVWQAESTRRSALRITQNEIKSEEDMIQRMEEQIETKTFVRAYQQSDADAEKDARERVAYYKKQLEDSKAHLQRVQSEDRHHSYYAPPEVLKKLSEVVREKYAETQRALSSTPGSTTVEGVFSRAAGMAKKSIGTMGGTLLKVLQSMEEMHDQFDPEEEFTAEKLATVEAMKESQPEMYGLSLYHLKRAQAEAGGHASGKVFLFRGVKQKVTAHNVAESWSENHSAAEKFDGKTILSEEIPFSRILTFYRTDNKLKRNNDEYGEAEYIVLSEEPKL